MSEEELVELLERFESKVTGRLLEIVDDNWKEVGNELRRMREEIKIEHSDLENRAITAETKLKLYEAMFEKLNLNLELDKKEVKND